MALTKINNNTLSAITGLPDGIVDADTLASGVGGKVLQVVYAENGTSFSTSNTSFTASGDIISITPSATSSKIFLMFNNNIIKSGTNNNAFGNIYRDINGGGYTALRGGRGYCQFNGYVSSTAILHMSSMIVLDSPNTTSECNYQSYFLNEIGGSLQVGEGGGHITSMIAWEVVG